MRGVLSSLLILFSSACYAGWQVEIGDVTICEENDGAVTCQMVPLMVKIDTKKGTVFRFCQHQTDKGLVDGWVSVGTPEARKCVKEDPTFYPAYPQEPYR